MEGRAKVEEGHDWDKVVKTSGMGPAERSSWRR